MPVRASSAWRTGKLRPHAARSRQTNPDSASENGYALGLLRLVAGRVGHDTSSALLVEDDLIGAAQDALHGFQVHALSGYVRCLLVLLVDL